MTPEEKLCNIVIPLLRPGRREVVRELGLMRGQARVDLAVIGPRGIHGHELKSDSDNIRRLPGQLKLYARCCRRVTVWCGPAHAESAVERAPPWAGIRVVGATGSVRIIRRGRRVWERRHNLAETLWVEEIVSVLKRIRPDFPGRRYIKSQIVRLLAKLTTDAVLRREVYETLVKRLESGKWRRRLKDGTWG